MLGAIIGDLAGSIYEYDQAKECRPVIIKDLINKNSFYSDDTILTIAVLDSILSGQSYESKLKEYILKYKDYKPNFSNYFKTSFSPHVLNWASKDQLGTSCGNGAMMRISPIGFLFNNEKDIIKNVSKATIPSHNSLEAIKSANIIALIIYYSRIGLDKNEIVDKLNLKIPNIKPVLKSFNVTCEETLPIVLYSWYYSKSFIDAIKIAISFGGDTDTNACIVGGIAEATYGVDEQLKQQALRKLPKEFVDLLKQAYKNALIQEL